MSFLEVLTQEGKIKNGEEESIRKQAEASNKTIDAVLLEKGIPAVEILKAKSKHFNIPYRELGLITSLKNQRNIIRLFHLKLRTEFLR